MARTTFAQHIDLSSLRPTFVYPDFHGQMLATWHSFGDGLFHPALVGLFGDSKLVYVVDRDGVSSGVATWEEARDIAVAARSMAGTPLRLVEQVSLVRNRSRR